MERLLYKKWKFCIKDFFSKCDQICSFLRIWLHLLKESLMKNFIFCVMALDYISAYKSQKVFVALAFEADNPRMKA